MSNRKQSRQLAVSGEADASQAPTPQAQSAAGSAEGGSVFSVASLLSIVSFLGGLLALLGYGVALAAEGRFGMPRAQLIDSTMDMLDLSTWAVLRIVSTGFTAFASLALYYKLLIAMIPSAILLCLGWLLAAWLLSLRSKRRHKAALAPPSASKANDKPFSFWVALGRTWWIPASVIVTPILTLVGLAALIGAATVLAIVPVLGMSAGEAHIDEYVVGPERCFSVKNQAERKAALLQSDDTSKKEQTAGAQCVSIKFTEGDTEIRGRVVFALSKAVILFDPQTGSVKRVPTEGAIVEVISSL